MLFTVRGDDVADVTGGGGTDDDDRCALLSNGALQAPGASRGTLEGARQPSGAAGGGSGGGDDGFAASIPRLNGLWLLVACGYMVCTCKWSL